MRNKPQRHGDTEGIQGMPRLIATPDARRLRVSVAKSWKEQIMVKRFLSIVSVAFACAAVAFAQNQNSNSGTTTRTRTVEPKATPAPRKSTGSETSGTQTAKPK